MAVRLLTPITVEGSPRCCQAALHGITTSTVVDTSSGEEDASAMFTPPGQLVWIGSNGGAGGFAFGICCATSITLRLRGNIRMHESGKDEISVYLNDALVWNTASSQTAGEAWNDFYDAGSPTSDELGYPYYEGALGSEQEWHDEVIPLTTRACGNVIKILAGYENDYPMDPGGEIVPGAANWRVEIIELAPLFP